MLDGWQMILKLSVIDEEFGKPNAPKPGSYLVEGIRTLSAAAMRHSRHHEQAVGILNLRNATKRIAHLVVVVHAVFRRDDGRDARRGADPRADCAGKVI